MQRQSEVRYEQARSGGRQSLEEILASIRKSLAEQSTDALSEHRCRIRAEPAKRMPRPAAQGAAYASGWPAPTAEASSRPTRRRAGDDLCRPARAPQPAEAAAAPEPRAGFDAPRPAAPPAAPTRQDPLWFLTRRTSRPPERGSRCLPAAAPSPRRGRAAAAPPRRAAS